MASTFVIACRRAKVFRPINGPVIPSAEGMGVLLGKLVLGAKKAAEPVDFVATHFEVHLGSAVSESKQFVEEAMAAIEHECLISEILAAHPEDSDAQKAIKASAAKRHYLRTVVAFKHDVRELAGSKPDALVYISQRREHDYDLAAWVANTQRRIDECNKFVKSAENIKSQALRFSETLARNASRRRAPPPASGVQVENAKSGRERLDKRSLKRARPSPDRPAREQGVLDGEDARARASASQRTNSSQSNSDSGSSQHGARSPSPVAPAGKRQKSDKQAQYVAELTNLSLGVKARTKAAVNLMESMKRSTLTASQQAVPVATTDPKSVRQFVEALEREFLIHEHFEHMWYLVYRQRMSPDVRSSIAQHFGSANTTVIPFEQAKDFLLRTFGAEENFLTVTARYAVECKYDPRTITAAAWSVKVRDARNKMLAQFGEKLISDAAMLLMFRDWLGPRSDTWLAREFYRIYKPAADPKWADIETCLDQLVSADAVVQSTKAGQKPKPNQTNSTSATPNVQPSQPPQPNPYPVRTSAAPRVFQMQGGTFCGFCKYLNRPHKLHKTRDCPYIDDAAFETQKREWKQAHTGSRSNRPGLGHEAQPFPGPPERAAQNPPNN